jgi:hypothetical protein
MVPTSFRSERIGSLRRRAICCAIASACAMVSGCAGAPSDAPPSTPSVLGDDKSDWAQDIGTRDTSVVRFTGEIDSFGASCIPGHVSCSEVDILLTLRVTPRPGSVDARAGVVWRAIDGREGTTVSEGFSLDASGDEIHRVRIRMPAGTELLAFTAWYQPEAYGETFYDDNDGELHLFVDRNMIHLEYDPESPTFDVDRVHGTLRVIVADIDFDKEVELVWSTDGWVTEHRFGLATEAERETGATLNRFLWAGDYAAVPFYDRFEIELDVPVDESVESFEYALVFRHAARSWHPYELRDPVTEGRSYILPR